MEENMGGGGNYINIFQNFSLIPIISLASNYAITSEGGAKNRLPHHYHPTNWVLTREHIYPV